MKRYYFIFLILICINSLYAQVGIGTTDPHSSSILDVHSENLGFLPPRLTTFERDNINNGSFATGLMIYNRDIKCLEVYNDTKWENLCGVAEVSLPDPPSNIASIPNGTASLSTTFCFDIAESEDLSNGTGSLQLREFQRSDFSEVSVNTKTLTFTSTTAVSNLTFYAEDPSGKVLASFTPDADYSSNSSLLTATAQIVYKESLSSPNPGSPSSGSALGLLRKDALTASYYAVYQDMINGGGSEVKVKFSPVIQDNQCSNLNQRTSEGPYYFLTPSGVANATGWNAFGYLGGGTVTSGNSGFETSMLSVDLADPIVGISQGYTHSVFFTSTGKVYINYITGFNGAITSGVGTDGIPVEIVAPNGQNIIDMASYSGGSVYRTEDGTLYAFGYIRYLPADNIPASSVTPFNSPFKLNIPQGVDIVKFDAAARLCLILGSNGKLYSSGYNNFVGRVGTGASPLNEFHEINFPTGAGNIVDFASSHGSSIAIDDLGKIYGFGQNDFGVLGSGSTGLKQTPVEITIPGMTGTPIKIWRNLGLSFILTDDNKLYSTGFDGYGESAQGTIHSPPGSNQFTDGFKPCALPNGVTPLSIHVMSYSVIMHGSDGEFYSVGAGHESNHDGYLLYRSLRDINLLGTKPRHTFHLIEAPSYITLKATETFIPY